MNIYRDNKIVNPDNFNPNGLRKKSYFYLIDYIINVPLDLFDKIELPFNNKELINYYSICNNKKAIIKYLKEILSIKGVIHKPKIYLPNIAALVGLLPVNSLGDEHCFLVALGTNNITEIHCMLDCYQTLVMCEIDPKSLFITNKNQFKKYITQSLIEKMERILCK